MTRTGKKYNPLIEAAQLDKKPTGWGNKGGNHGAATQAECGERRQQPPRIFEQHRFGYDGRDHRDRPAALWKRCRKSARPRASRFGSRAHAGEGTAISEISRQT